jgi:chromosome segregation ATPase
MVKKKKQALDNLMNDGKISQSTYGYLNKEVTEALTTIEADQKILTEKMTVRATELEQQIKSLEMFLANLEIHHATGEINDESYDHQNGAISLGLDATKQELSDIKEALVDLIPEKVVAAQPKPEKVDQISEIEKAEKMIEERIEASTRSPPVETPTETEETNDIDA